MNYLIVGAGGTGGSIGGYLAKGGKNVTLVARGKHLAAIRKNGLRLKSTRFGDFVVYPAAYTAEECPGVYDVIFVCVKSYALSGIVPLIRRAANCHTVIIPILNVFGVGDLLGGYLPGYTVLDGCIYISAFISGDGEIDRAGDIFRVVFGIRPRQRVEMAGLSAIRRDLEECGIQTVLSDNIRRDTFRKHAFLSPYAAVSAYYDIKTASLQASGEEREFYIALIKEMVSLGRAMGVPMEMDLVKEGITRIDQASPEMTASMQKDMKQGKPDERDVLLFEPVRRGREFGVPMPNYERVARQFGFSE